MSLENQYIEGFNNGYLLSKYEPQLLQKISPNLQASNQYLDGLLEGKQQQEREVFKKSLSQLSDLRNKGLEKSNEIDRETQ